MSNYIAFTKKEWIENSRTYKRLIMLCTFILFGMMSPVTAKLMPEILKRFMPKGMEITLTTPGVIDAWSQFYSNISQMGMFLMVILFSGILANEYAKGTLIIMITKGLSRDMIILSKFSAMVSLWTISYVIGGLTSWGYSTYLFPGENLKHLTFSLFSLWIYGIFLLAILLFMGTIAKNSYGALLLTGVVVVVMMVLNILPTIKKYNPIFLSNNMVTLLQKTVEVKDFVLPMSITIGAIGLLLVGSILIFRKRQL